MFSPLPLYKGGGDFFEREKNENEKEGKKKGSVGVHVSLKMEVLLRGIYIEREEEKRVGGFVVLRDA